MKMMPHIVRKVVMRMRISVQTPFVVFKVNCTNLCHIGQQLNTGCFICDVDPPKTFRLKVT